MRREPLSGEGRSRVGAVLDARPPSRERRARIAWARLCEPDDEAVRTAVAQHGVVGALERLAAGALPGERFSRRAATLDVDRDEEIAARLGARILTPADPEWPEQLDRLRLPPFCLWARGGPVGPMTERAVSMVGARAATAYGESMAADIAAGLVDRGFTVVSGAAYGIDGAAHRGALAADGLTVAVLACGIDRAYPQGHRSLIDRIAEDGGVVAEVPPGSAPHRGRFLTRNRLIAALATGTLVVEAGLRSGTMRTAREAEALGRVLMALPGPVTSMASAGCHELIRSGGAQLVTDAAEVAELCGRMGQSLLPVPRAPQRPGDDLDPTARVVRDALSLRRAEPVEAVAGRAALDPGATLAALGRLELEGLARRDETGRWRSSGRATGVGPRGQRGT